MEIIKVEDNLRYAVVITNEEVEDNGIITGGQFNPQVVMNFVAQIPEMADVIKTTEREENRVHLNMACFDNYVIIAADFDQDDSIGHLVKEAEGFADDAKRTDDVVFAQAIELFVRILSDKLKIKQAAGKGTGMRGHSMNLNELCGYDDENDDISQESCIFAMKQTPKSLDYIMHLRSALEKKKMLGKGAVLYKDEAKRAYFIDLAGVLDIKDAAVIGYTALEMGFSRAKPIRSYLKEHGKVFPIL
jgi:hypothetical protein